MSMPHHCKSLSRGQVSQILWRNLLTLRLRSRSSLQQQSTKRRSNNGPSEIARFTPFAIARRRCIASRTTRTGSLFIKASSSTITLLVLTRTSAWSCPTCLCDYAVLALPTSDVAHSKQTEAELQHMSPGRSFRGWVFSANSSAYECARDRGWA